jgi:hypothetical protein
LIPTGIFNKMFFNDCEASATINEFCSQSEPYGRAVPMNNLDRNLRFGWWSLLIFLSLGGGLEILHGFKIGWYVDVANDMRRLMFTLAHAHGTALALVNIAAGLDRAKYQRLSAAAIGLSQLDLGGNSFPSRIFPRRNCYLRRRPWFGHLAGPCCRPAAFLLRRSDCFRLVQIKLASGN